MCAGRKQLNGRHYLKLKKKAEMEIIINKPHKIDSVFKSCSFSDLNVVQNFLELTDNVKFFSVWLERYIRITKQNP